MHVGILHDGLDIVGARRAPRRATARHSVGRPAGAVGHAARLLPQGFSARRNLVDYGFRLPSAIDLVPLQLNFTEDKVKVELALARGKQACDKRQDMVRRDAQRGVTRELGRRANGMT